MFHFKFVVTLVLGQGLSSHSQFSSGPANSLSWESCHYGDVIQNTCNTCTCTSKGIYKCEPRDCDTTVQDLTSTKVCEPNKVYYRQGTHCICRGEGRWPHKFCHELFRALPKQFIEKKTCEPEGYVQIDCKICRCSAKGDVDTTRCTINDCDEEKIFRKSNDVNTGNMFGSCKVNNWYSMAPCQLCFCVDTNKLICSTGVSKPSGMPIGQNSLTLCGPDFLKQAAALMPKLKTVAHLSPFIYGSPIHLVKNPSLNMLPPNSNHYSFHKTTPKNLAQLAISFEANLDTMPSTKMEPLDFSFDPVATLKKLMGTRRTLTINSGAKCVPGTVTSIKCNICHCLTNGKMICSNHQC